MARMMRKILNSVFLSRPLTGIYDRVSPLARLGDRGERAAERYLLKKGYVIVGRGYQDKFGEIDLVAVDDETIVFVEVKTRAWDVAGLPAEAVDEKKQKHLTKTGIGYLKWHRLTQCRARFDVVAIIWPGDSKSPEITHYENAFEPVGEFQMF